MPKKKPVQIVNFIMKPFNTAICKPVSAWDIYLIFFAKN